METSIKKFIANSNKYVMFATMGVLIPLVLGIACSFFYVQNLKTNLFFGAVITATSVSITVEALMEMKKIKSSVGLAILGADVVDDVIGILFLTVNRYYEQWKLEPIYQCYDAIKSSHIL